MGQQTVSREEWQKARESLLAKEKAHTRASDALAAERRRLPRVLVEKDYRFETTEGSQGFEAIFEGRRQLIVYHHMLKPADPAPCRGCAMFVDNLGNPAHLNARDTTLVLVSRAPVRERATPASLRLQAIYISPPCRSDPPLSIAAQTLRWPRSPRDASASSSTMPSRTRRLSS